MLFIQQITCIIYYCVVLHICCSNGQNVASYYHEVHDEQSIDYNCLVDMDITVTKVLGCLGVCNKFNDCAHAMYLGDRCLLCSDNMDIILKCKTANSSTGNPISLFQKIDHGRVVNSERPIICPSCKPGYSGQYCEDVINPSNLALFRPTNQSALGHFMGNSSNAVDGNTDDYYLNGSCSHSGYELNPWWSVTLSEVSPVYRVVITNRGDETSYVRLRYMSLFVSNDDNNPLLSTDKQLCAYYEGPADAPGNFTFYCGQPLYGRYVSVLLNLKSAEAFSLCDSEVEIYS